LALALRSARRPSASICARLALLFQRGIFSDVESEAAARELGGHFRQIVA
jgi:hypothetical protein